MIELRSDLGGGKTTFTRGLAAGISSPDQVSSPTFTLTNIYAGNKLTLHHYDFYRLFDPGIMRDELLEVLEDEQAVVVVEWADIIENALPEERMTVTITATGETSRQYNVTVPESLNYLMKGMPL